MKNTPRIVAASAFALAAACASAPDAAPRDTTPVAAEARGEVDPVGGYTFTTTVQGRTVDGHLRITGTPGSWAGSFHTPVTGELPLSSVDVYGQEVRITANTPDGMVHVRMMFSGDTYTGDWSLGAEAGAISGRRTG